MNNYKFIIPFYNVEKWINLNIESILSQKNKNFSCFYVNDLSTDKSLDILMKYRDIRINITNNKYKNFALKNICEAIEASSPEDEDIIVLLDGDDWLANESVLDCLDKHYDSNTLLTYGTYVEYPQMKLPDNLSDYSEYVKNNNLYRKDIWRASHLRTFKYKLWKNIKKEDLKDLNGEYYKMAWDLAIMFPMLEMSNGRFKYVKDILYCYNMSNPLNDHKVDHRLQQSLDKQIRNKKSYEKIF